MDRAATDGSHGVSPTARSLKRLRELGYMVQVVERFNPGARVRQDLYSFIDILAVRPGEILGVQACTVGDLSKRLAKIESDGVRAKGRRWLEAGGRIEVHGWGKYGPRGKRKVWDVRVVTLAELAPQEET